MFIEFAIIPYNLILFDDISQSVILLIVCIIYISFVHYLMHFYLVQSSLLIVLCCHPILFLNKNIEQKFEVDAGMPISALPIEHTLRAIQEFQNSEIIFLTIKMYAWEKNTFSTSVQCKRWKYRKTHFDHTRNPVSSKIPVVIWPWCLCCTYSKIFSEFYSTGILNICP